MHGRAATRGAALIVIMASCGAAPIGCSAEGAPNETGGAPASPDGGSTAKGGGGDGSPEIGGDAGRADAMASSDSGGTAASNDGGSAPKGDGGSLAFGHPSAATVADAIAAPLSYYHRNASTGDIWCLPCDGAPVMLAIASYTGDTSTDARLLEQMRHFIATGNEPFATGAYAANDERNATAMYAIAKQIPRVWSQLSAAEVHKIDLVMQATLVAGLYTTADKTNAGGAPRDLTGSNDSNRDYNPNYREGMIGAVLVGTEYFGGKSAVDALVTSYDHAAFTSELQAQTLTNAYWTFSTYQTNASAGAPSASTVQQGITGYAMHGITLDRLLDLYLYLANDTFSATVSCGLNGGAGISGAGKISSGCSGLPNVGKVGMEKEFDGIDGAGQRSSAGYARLGERDDLYNMLVLMLYGDWRDTAASRVTAAQVSIGVTDYFYKATQGYLDYASGKVDGLFKCGSDTDCPLNQAMWSEVLAPPLGF